MIRVYVAGPYSADNALDVLRNIGMGQKAAARLFALGFAPFAPWHDRTFIMDNPEGQFTVDHFYQYSLEWLKVSDCMYVLAGWMLSKGTEREIEFARKHEIPVFYYEQALLKWAEGMPK
jgi:hypothetical protein